MRAATEEYPLKRLKLGMDVGIDLGSNTVKIFTGDRQIALTEPTMVAVDRDTDEILAFGSDARQMLGRTPEHIAVVLLRPSLRDPVERDGLLEADHA